ncbi:hypothetical protein EMIHUDRAFT_202843 [Emiliania huxleyi CCMP1516]|uniref:Dymeclin n=2 Tax=Emiliania huxleyi TaxID=2903 RepID=A0A0D3K8W7_EMIH1|nr:hypothetical protein EMIHUDRAFT_202843 [Emiliania huxleyi CCMP1516]EOD32202.1 hypothetical protein EMIHUDRAFT_202843 [Emiliania huxleyi CCMP1516]|eukprot:XP_005784631.1 hypothetical protein EMIHUDRAFT_202843 [Emiliania huxleyi CCMP1516]
MFAPAQLPYTATAALLMSLQPILVSLSKNEAGGFDYSVPASTMLSELLKLLLSSGLLLRQMATCAPSELLSEQPWAEMLSYSLPGLIYFVNNNCLFFILQEVDPTTFQLLSQMKTLFTGLLFRLFLRRRLSAVQYLALAASTAQPAVSQLPTYRTEAGGTLVHKHIGGVYSEKLLKGRASASIHWQNVQLYLWGVAFNAIGVYTKDRQALLGPGDRHSLPGGSLAISAVLKYADNIARVYAHAIAMMAEQCSRRSTYSLFFSLATKLISSDEPNDDSARGSGLDGGVGPLGHGLGSSAASTQAAARNPPKR